LRAADPAANRTRLKNKEPWGFDQGSRPTTATMCGSARGGRGLDCARSAEVVESGGDSTTSAKGSSLRADRWRQSPAPERAPVFGALVSWPPSFAPGLFLAWSCRCRAGSGGGGRPRVLLFAVRQLIIFAAQADPSPVPIAPGPAQIPPHPPPPPRDIDSGTTL
jgi:hypothetical protein